MALRKRNSPGIEINEIDRSQYDKQTDYSLPNAPTFLITGFADKGENYKTQWINSRNTLIDTYGIPNNTAEQYFYNAAIEILSHGGILLTHKLPYKNDSINKYTYVEYEFSNCKTIVPDITSNKSEYKIIGDLYKSLVFITSLIDKNNNEIFDNNYNNLDILQIKDMCINVASKNNIAISINKTEEIDYEEINNIAIILKKLILELTNKLNISFSYIDILNTDKNLNSYIEIQKIHSDKLLTLENFDNLLTIKNIKQSLKKDNTSGKITIVNITNNKYEKTSWNSIKTIDETDNQNAYTNDCLGIVPIIITSANALYYQKLLNINKKNNQTDDEIIDQYNVISGVCVRKNEKINQDELQKKQIENSLYLTRPFKSSKLINDNYIDVSWSKIFSSYFPNITYNSENTFDTENLKKIGIVVVKVFEDKTSNKLNFEILESFVGSLDKTKKDLNTKQSIFIDNIVNTQSQYINVFTSIDEKELEKASFLAINNQICESTGFFEHECKKIIDYTDSIINPLNKMFGVLNNSTTTNIDIVIDAGISNISQYLIGENKLFDNNINFNNVADISRWFNVIQIFDNFCKNIRKDCIFIADAPRPLCLDGDYKKIRYTKPENTIENVIIPKMKFISNINSSYTIGYCNWFYCIDEYTRDFFWCPPSIKAAGIYCDVDINSYSWSAPAGVHRGKVFNAYDTAFSPTDDEAGKIYTYCWNYAINYPIDGIILEGQKTFQKNKTALDRINVRRLMLYLEKRTKRIARIFLYEGNTAFLRQKFVDTLKPLFEDAKNNYGISDYVIKCDEVNNTTETIERGELHVAIAVKPIKTVEYIVINFIVTNQSANVNEEVLQ